MSRGNARQQIFLDANDYTRFLTRLTVTAARFGVRCRAYCLMVTHFHLLLEPNLFPLSRMMQQLNSSYTQSFNRRHERVGHVLQGRFKSPMIDGDDYFRRVDPSVAQRRYVAFVAGGPPGRTDRLPGPVADGPKAFLSHLGMILEAHRDEAEVTYAERFACRPSLNQIFECADDAAAFDQSMHEAFERHGYTLREIGDFVRRPANTVWRRIRRVNRQTDRRCLWKT
jgi:REP element-mobilizing transposase RayT